MSDVRPTPRRLPAQKPVENTLDTSDTSQVKPTRPLAIAIAALTLIAAAPAISSAQETSAATAAITESWAVEYGGYNRSSSPAIGDIDGNGVNDVVWGDENGYIYATNATGAMMPGFPVPAVIPPSTGPTPVTSSPTLADLDGNGDLEIIVGVGTRWAPRHRGGMLVLEHTGAVRWVREGFDKFDLWSGVEPGDGYGEPVHGTAAVGDIDGDGWDDVVWGGWDHRVWAADRNGNILPGFPYDNYDTIWSSPALYDVDGDGRHEIFIGADATFGATPCGGGRYWSLDWQNGSLVVLWTKCTGESFKSSTAIGDIDGDGRMEAIIGGGDFYGHPDGRRVFAWHIDDGSALPGWPIQVSDVVYASPALGDLDGDGIDEVVVTSWDERVYAYHGDGSLYWSAHPTLPSDSVPRDGMFFGSPVIADLDGDGDQDVLATNIYATWALRGTDGVWMMDDPINAHWAVLAASSPAVGDFGAHGWKIVAGGARTIPSSMSRMAAYSIPTPGASPEWPMWRGNPDHTAAPASGGDPLPPHFCRGPENPAATPADASSDGYWILGAEGRVLAFDAPHYGDISSTMPAGRTAVAITETNTGNGYWILDSAGGVHAFGDAVFHGSMEGHVLNSPIISMAATPTGNGYWLLGQDGGVFTFGAANYHGSTGNIALNAPVVAMAPAADGNGYWLLAQDGGVFTFGSAVFRGSTGAMTLNAPVISMAVHPSGGGYWLLAQDGGVFSFGVSFRGSVPGVGLCSPPNAIELRPTRTGAGYYALIDDGGLFTFGDAKYRGADPAGIGTPVDLAVR